MRYLMALVYWPFGPEWVVLNGVTFTMLAVLCIYGLDRLSHPTHRGRNE